MKNIMPVDSQIYQCADLIKNSNSIAVLTGAGISTNAGIPDFRGPNGFYVTKRYDPDTVFDIDYFYRDPKPFFDFARDFVRMEEKIEPTFTHNFLAELEKLGRLKGIATQNIDSLHHKAGSKNVLEIHGSVWKSFCLECGKEYSYDQMKAKLFKEDIPKCTCKGTIKPDVVFFGEAVKHIDEAFELAAKADLFFVIGTSLVVQPAASIPSMTRGKIVVVNMGEVEVDLDNIVLTVTEDMDEFFKKVAKCLEL